MKTTTQQQRRRRSGGGRRKKSSSSSSSCSEDDEETSSEDAVSVHASMLSSEIAQRVHPNVDFFEGHLQQVKERAGLTIAKLEELKLFLRLKEKTKKMRRRRIITRRRKKTKKKTKRRRLLRWKRRFEN